MVMLFVEGGGDSSSLRAQCREGFRKFIENAALKGRMPRIIACGSRSDAYDSFCTAINGGKPALMLVDSEGPVDSEHNEKPWAHLKHRQGDGWDKPAGADDNQCHLMVQCMESWLVADRNTFASYFGQGFQANKLPALTHPIEAVAKDDLYKRIKEATANCKTKAPYGKGKHSFALLAKIDPYKVTAASPWAKRFIDHLKERALKA